jgi:hypothetical protein
MPLELHPEAARNFDEKGAELATQTVPGPLPLDQREDR